MCNAEFWSSRGRRTNTPTTLLVIFALWGHLVHGAGYFPKLIDLAALKPITATSTCGSVSSRYCSSGTSPDSVQVCTEKVCNLGCCATCGSKTPRSYDLGQGTRNGIENGPPRTGSIAASLRFQLSRKSWITPSDIPFIEYVNKGFAVSVWIKQATDNKGVIVSKLETRPPYTQMYSLLIQNYKIWFYYQNSASNTTFVEVEPLESDRQKLNLQQNEWHFISVTVINTDLVYFIDGEYIRGASLTGSIKDDGGAVYVGRKDRFTDANQYEGLMQDLFMYPQALTNREVIEAFTGSLPTVYVESQCRCPPNFPKIKPDQPAKCVKNGEIQNNEASRISTTGHPVEFVLDNVLATYWLSQLTDAVTLDINLEHGELQVFHVLMTFYGPFPKGIKIEKSINQGQTFQEWQYFAENCQQSFSMADNGRLMQPDSVNCIKYSSPLPYDQGQIVFRTEQAPPAGSSIPIRPFGSGCNLLYCSEKLLEFLKATNIRLHFHNHTLVQNAKHKYFGLRRVHVIGRCECHGHATDASYMKGNSTQNGTCICKCISSTNTEGDKCEKCKPLYNNKPFKRGDNSDSYPCVKCECNDHADSCYYNRSLDQNPSSRTQGGGGVCINCQHNTEGRFCHMCRENFYRESGKNLKAVDVCTPCSCVGPGVPSNMTNCTRDDSTPGVMAGQCHCKINTQGRQCDTCKSGFYDLKTSDPNGCAPCGCNLDGSRGGNASCHATTGQCDCKTNVQGLKCNQCKPGYFNLIGGDLNGCRSCNCDPHGTKNGTICDSNNGQCVCKTGSTGKTCFDCSDGYHSPSSDGCKSCNCSENGTISGLIGRCDKRNGQCQCRLYVTGKSCDKCKDGYFGLDKNKQDGCSPCSCDPKGTETGKLCDILSGNCSCKPNVVGKTCNQCKLGTYGMNQSNTEGCVRCNCFPKGTIDGDKKRPEELTCSSDDGKCLCLSNVIGQRCDACADQYYWNPVGQGCVPCRCHTSGSVSGTTCNVTTGQCVCKANIGGLRCDRCSPGYYGFNNGQCQACSCNSSGSVSSSCDSLGQCTCKQNVQGRKCDSCKPNTVNLQPSNPFGCSGAPSEQPAPSAVTLSSRAIQLTWLPPDNPNGVILRYELYRNNTLIYNATARQHNDTGLAPYTRYTYHIITFTERGSTRSERNANARTFEDIPGGISVPLISDILPRSAKATWSIPMSPNGIIVQYRLVSVNSRIAVEQTHCQATKIFSCDITDLKPYTVYNFTLVVCTRAGCGRSLPSMNLTKSTRPESQPPPVVTSLPGGRSVSVTWDEPAEPNGRIFRYELHMRRSPFAGDWELKYQSFPLNNPQNANLRRTNVTDLTPFTEYEFLVRSYTAPVAGDTPSNITRHRTGEAVPAGASAVRPNAASTSATTVRITWNPPQTPHGIIIRYEIYRYESSSNFATPIKTKEVNGTTQETVLINLKPFLRYKFTVKACNSYACSEHSGEVYATTAAGAPTGQGPPTAITLDSTAIALNWSEPEVLNGPRPPTYRLHRAYAALYNPPPRVTAGAHFPGLGYYKFPAEFVKSGATNNIEFFFRTQYADGLIMFLASQSQHDILAIELRVGKPWFIFDCQDKLVSFTIAQTVRFDDNQFHHVQITRNAKVGTLLIDSKYSATGTSNGSSTVISTNTGVYVGGLPKGFEIVRRDANQITSKLNFIGCLRSIKSDGNLFVWNKAIQAVSVDPVLSGCPSREKAKGMFLRGGGYAIVKPGIFRGGNIFTLHFKFRTELQSGLLLFAYSSVAHFALRLISNGSAIEILISTPTTRVRYLVKPASGSLSDGRWHQVQVTSITINLAVVIDGKSSTFQPLSKLSINSDLYVGGVPWGTNAAKILQQSGVDLDESFGGCISDIEVIPRKVNPVRDVIAMMNADLDGCRRNTSVTSSGSERNSSVIYENTAERFNDTGVRPFTDYLYRVESFHPGTVGSAKSTWVAVRSGQGAPSGIGAPKTLTPLIGGRAVHVTWTSPQIANGILTKFVILSYDTSNPGSEPIESTILDTSSLNGTINGLKPYTTYNIRIAMYTMGGSAVGPGRNVTTEQSVPEGVPAPSAERRPRSLYVYWSAPSSENGIIIGYNLTVNSQLVYSGIDRNFTVLGLSVYTAYNLQLTACTVIGCEEGPVVIIYTGELPPDGFNPPILTTLGPNEVEVAWSQPRQPNGIIVRYEVLVGTSDVTSQYESRYNGSRAHLSTVVRNLTAGTLYYVRVMAYSGGGGTLSNATTVTTKPDVPADIPPPDVTPISPYALFVNILPPRKPNGVIIRYELYVDGHLAVNGTATNHTATGFRPFSLHKFRVRACTVVGCSSSPEGEAYTLEISPNGTLLLNASIFNATTITAWWSRVAVPNGNLSYNLMIQGEFLLHSSQKLLTEVRIERAISTLSAERMFSYTGLIAFNNYTVWVNASNTVGFVLSNTISVTTPEYVPGGFKPLNVTVLSSESVHVSWAVPVLPNGNLLGYQLHQREAQLGSVERVIYRGSGLSTRVVGLSPYTTYEFRVSANTSVGPGYGPYSRFTTMEDVPGPIDPPNAIHRDSLFIVLGWSPPTPPNGVLLHYVVYQNGSEVARVTGNTTQHRVTGLQPYTLYVFRLNVCTKVGCRNSSISNIRTLESVPEGLSPPRLSSPSPRKVVVSWDEPSVTNGKIAFYVIERRVKGQALPVNVSQIAASLSRRFTDIVQPVTTYEYRIVAYTSVGGTPGPYTNITTAEGDPEGIDPPTFSAITSTSISVNWAKPRIPNGRVTHYIVRVLETSRNVTINSSTQFSYTVTDLRSYFLYRVVISACTIGGCGDSGYGTVRTLPAIPKGQPPPTATVVSSSSLRVRWNPPEFPNGAILRYELHRRTVEDPVNENFTSPTSFVTINQGQVTNFVDTGLGIYSLQQYKVTVVTQEGTNTSEPSRGFRTGPEPPLAGPFVNATALNHTAVKVTWSPPATRLLRGSPQSYRVRYTDLSLPSKPVTVFGTVAGDVTNIIVVKLKPSTDYDFQVFINNGAGEAASRLVKERTQDGAPEGFDTPPDLYVISSSEIRVTWGPPTTPNGRIILYNIIANGVTRANTTGELTKTLTGLLPYESYEIKVEVCTVYKCTTSRSRTVRTESAAPTGLAPPQLTPGPTSMGVNWAPPSRPNGQLSGYQLFRRKIEDCPTGPIPDTVCTYIECPLAFRLCGTVCYNPTLRTCCNGVLHNKDATKFCCGQNYLNRNSPADVCCGNAFHNQRPDYQCCYGNYVRVHSSYICCPSKGSGHVIGMGNACCGDTPYTNDSQVCVCGGLYGLQQGRQLQCCGGKVVAAVQICCEDSNKGTAYDLDSSKSCCGSYYVPTDWSLCCRSPSGNVKVYNYSSAVEKTRSNEKCCSTKKVSRDLSCCNKNGYNSTTQTCADRSSAVQTGCGSGIICNKTDTTMAYCDQCDFDRTTMYCGSVGGYYRPTPTATSPPKQCGTAFIEILKNQLNPNILSFTDTNLVPHTVYSYYLVAINGAGNTSSEVAENRTLMASPEGLDPPIPVVISSTAIRITWKAPARPNGIIRQYRLRRIKQNPVVEKVIYTGLNLSFTDSDGLDPFTGYQYVLEACTTKCAERSAEQVVFTSQDAPAYVNATSIKALSPVSLNLSWHKPLKPNGIIVRYNVSQVINSTYSIHLNPDNKGLDMSLVVGGLKPYTSYSFSVVACTVVGCTASPVASGLTMETAPQGVNPPDLIVRSAVAIEAIWTVPETPNGIIRYYTLWRGNTAVYNGTDVCITKSNGKFSCNFTDVGLSPVTTYNYTLQSATGGGSTRSVAVNATTPESSPEGIPRPRLTPRSSSSIYAEWGVPNQPNGAITQYILIVGRDEYSTGVVRNKLVDGLQPFTCYDFRVRACTIRGCGAGEASTACTLEAPPQGQGPPRLVPREWNVVEVSWSGPTTPNGILTQYEIDRKSDNEVPQIVCVTTKAQGLKTSCLNSGGSLRGYTVYFYRVRVRNSAGADTSVWRDVRTLEGPPSGIGAPTINVLNSTAISASWQKPQEPNGIITHYELRYQEFPSLSNNMTVASRVTHTVFNVTVGGFKPSTSYQFVITAVNRWRVGSSPPALAKTLEAPPAGIQPLRASKSPDGKSMRIYWDPPSSPNGVITGYNLYMDGVQRYRGIDRQYSVRKLQPFTAYVFELEACTGVGCTRGEPVTIMSAEILPEGQGVPTFSFVNATVVVIRWKPPAIPNGIITRYEVLRQENSLNARKRRAISASGVTVVYATNDTNKTDFGHVDSGLKPYTRYEYKIRAVNSAGNGESDWTAVETKQSSPAGVATPTVTQIDASTLLVTWVKPAQPNGIITFYFVERNGSTVHKGGKLNFTDTDREPFTVYSYTVFACTGGGCTASAPGYGKTAEAAPEQVAPPVLTAVSGIAIIADWVEPGKPNGIITKYELYEGTARVYSGLLLTFSLSGRTPYTEYTYSVSACTSAGCTHSANTTVRTKEAPPENIRAPILTVGGSNLIRARWEPPEKPNGKIVSYELRRNGTLVYTGTDTRFDDRTVAPYRVYSYIVTAINSKGRVSSPAGFSKATHPGAPDNVSVPVLTVLSSVAIMAQWKPPALSNGIITRYYVLYDANQGQDMKEVLVGTQQTYNITQLKPYTWYEVQIKACTSSGCSTGELARARTLQAPPEGQRPPAFPSANIAARSVLVTWFEPVFPNGLILSYQLHRRQVITVAGNIDSRGPEMIIYNTTNNAKRSFLDTTVKPYSKYEFRVVSANGAGSSASIWSVVNTLQAPPENIYAPEVTGIYADKLEVLIKIPETPNGEIRNYTLLVSGQPDLFTDSSLRLTVSGLEPFTVYQLRVQACTDGGCNRSSTIQQRTAEGIPTDFEAPRVVDKNSTAVEVEWKPPRKPYGTILRYDVLFGQTCSRIPCSATNETAAGQQTRAVIVGLKPYFSYDVKIRAHNSRHSGLSNTLKVTTLAADPEVTGNAPVVNVSSYDVLVDWSECFILNGPLVKYVLLQNGVPVFETQMPQTVKTTLPDRSLGEYTYYVRATTLVGGTEKTVTSDRITVQVPSSVSTIPSKSPQTAAIAWYSTAWFIAVVALIGIILLFIILALILRRTSGDRTVYVRERDPLPPRSKLRSRPPSMSSLYSTSSRKGGSLRGYPMHAMQQPFNTSTTALFDSSERVNSRLDKPYDQFDRYDRNDSSFNKYALDDENEWDGQISFYDPALMNSLNNGKGDRDSGMFDEKTPMSDDENTPYLSLKKEQYFTDTHL